MSDDLLSKTNSTALSKDPDALLNSEPEPTSDHIGELALGIFDGTQVLHGLSQQNREVLKQATRLRKSRLRLTKKKSFQTALRLVNSQVGLDLSEESQRSLAGVTAVVQDRLKAGGLDKLAFTPAQQQEILTISAILQIAEGLDQSADHSTTIEQVEVSEDGLWIVVSGPQAELDGDSAERRSALWLKLGYPEISVLLPEQAALRAAPFPKPLDVIGIHPHDLLSEAGRKVMRYHFAEMLRHEAGTRLGEDIESLHDMRVATRRLRAAFEVFGSAFDKKALKPHLDGLRAAGRTLGAVRDMDVFMEKAQKYLETLPEDRQSGLNPLLEHWKEQRDLARLEMTAYLDSKAYARFKRDFNVFLNSPFAGAKQAGGSEPEPQLVRQIAPVLIYTRLASVRAFETHLEDAPIERLHMLRIEFKKLRYTVEYFQEVLGKRCLEVIETLKILQDHLGDLNDAQVATQIVGDFIAGSEQDTQAAPISERESLEEVVSYLAFRHAERHRLVTTFRETWSANFDQKRFRRRVAQSVALL
jgi:CHAD domain-containing protein